MHTHNILLYTQSKRKSNTALASMLQLLIVRYKYMRSIKAVAMDGLITVFNHACPSNRLQRVRASILKSIFIRDIFYILYVASIAFQ